MTYRDAVAYLDSFVNYERAVPDAAGRTVFDLSRIQELAERLGRPAERLSVLHVAGTKGKGSCCAFAAAILRAAGLRVGLYTSPHLRDLRERIRVDGALIPEADFARHLERCKPLLDEMRARPEGSRRPTYFEVLTHLAFLHFAESQVDAAVVEVGLGGRLDATNIVSPVACAITSLSLDHTAILGSTLDAIAREKAGILKPGVPGVTAPQAPEAAAALEESARAAGAPLEWLGKSIQVRLGPRIEGSLRRSVEWEASGARPSDRIEAELGLGGAFQAENWGLAVRLAQLFIERTGRGRLPASAIREGSLRVQWPGRMEELPRRAGQPRRILDGAHNEFSLGRVLSELEEAFPQAKPRVALFACAKDKDVQGMLRRLAHGVDQVVFTYSGNARGVPSEELAEQWRSLNAGPSQAEPDLSKAWDLAAELAGPEGYVIATGSLYLVGALHTLLNASE